MRSRVTPSTSSTMEIRSPAIRLKSVDFPTLGRPTIAIVGRAMISSFLMKGETSVQERLSSFHNSLCFSSSFLVSSCSG